MRYENCVSLSLIRILNTLEYRKTSARKNHLLNETRSYADHFVNVERSTNTKHVKKLKLSHSPTLSRII